MLRILVPVLMLSLPALAQEGPRGIAFAVAPEQSSGMALAATPEAAIAGAVADCAAGGADPRDCFPTSWCMPAGWSVVVGVMHEEGLHWSEQVCGLPSRRTAEVVGAALCDPEGREFRMLDCAVGQIYDPEGQPVLDY